VELGEVLVPALTPLTWQDPDDRIRLGRVTEWRELGPGVEGPFGQKMLLVDGEEFPLLELRELDIVPATVPVS
jgi:type VI secretion system protein ImpE